MARPLIVTACQRIYDEYLSHLRYVDVEALTVGAWMAEVVELDAMLKAASEAGTRQVLAELEREKAARIKLD